MKHITRTRDEILQKLGNTTITIAKLSGMCNSVGRIQTSAIYHTLRREGTIQPWKKAIRKGFVPPKFSFIFWLTFKGKIGTNDHLRYLDIDSSCYFCTTPESAQHLFFVCGFSSTIWRNIQNWLQLSQNSTMLLSAAKWIKKDRRAHNILTKARWIALTATIYFIWKARNAAAFDGKRCTPNEVCHVIKTHVYQVLFNAFTNEAVNTAIPTPAPDTVRIS